MFEHDRRYMDVFFRMTFMYVHPCSQEYEESFANGIFDL